MLSITKTRLCNFDPLKPHIYKVKLGFTGVYVIFLIFIKNIDCGYSLEPPQAVLTSTYNLCFEQKYEKYRNFLSENFPFLLVKFSIYLNRRIFATERPLFHMRTKARISLCIQTRKYKLHYSEVREPLNSLVWHRKL